MTDTWNLIAVIVLASIILLMLSNWPLDRVRAMQIPNAYGIKPDGIHIVQGADGGRDMIEFWFSGKLLHSHEVRP